MGKFSMTALCGVAAATLAIGVALRPDQAIRTATGLTSHTLCSAVFVSGLDPEEVYVEVIRPTPGLRQLDWALHYTIDKAHRKVTTTWVGAFESEAVFRSGMGCLLTHGVQAVDEMRPSDHAACEGGIAPALERVSPGVVEPTDTKLRAALDQIFAERSQPPYRATKAVVIVRKGRIIAERYAPGYGVDTPMLGWSMTKSVINALIGILVHEGRLTVEQPAPVPEWRDRNDPRHAITIDHLMRMTSGLAVEETDSGFDPATHMLYLENDMAAFAQGVGLNAPPGSRWQYTSGNTLILSRIIRDAVGGHASDVLCFARRELFEPLGMRNVTLEFDAVGTPIGATYMLASARDWARFGMLYLEDGTVDGRRILPEGWVRYSTTSTLGKRYGAGWWTNRGAGGAATHRVRPDLPADSFFASGALGQRVVVIPSEKLVIVRLGVAQDRPGFDMEGLMLLVADVITALHSPPDDLR